MQQAIALGARRLGSAFPNPAVGCVIVKDGAILARGITHEGGRPHAEVEALKNTNDAKGATMYVSLEPCAHHGKTPPCAEAIIKAGISRVVIAMADPDPRVSGKGIEMLKAAGIQVEVGVDAVQAAIDHEGFFKRIGQGRPMFTLKMASTVDGRIYAPERKNGWISGMTSLAYAHKLRASHDAIMVGIGTALIDNPQLTCRLPGCTNVSPIRIVVDTQLRIPPASKLVLSAREVPLWVIAGDKADARALEENGVRIIRVATRNDKIDLNAMAQKLGEEGFTRVLVEGGASLAGSLIGAKLIDHVEWVTAPFKAAGSAQKDVKTPILAAFSGVLQTTRLLGEDKLETYVLKR